MGYFENFKQKYDRFVSNAKQLIKNLENKQSYQSWWPNTGEIGHLAKAGTVYSGPTKTWVHIAPESILGRYNNNLSPSGSRKGIVVIKGNDNDFPLNIKRNSGELPLLVNDIEYYNFKKGNGILVPDTVTVRPEIYRTADM